MIYAMGKYHIDLSKVVMITEALHYKNAIGWYCVIETTERQFMIEHIFPDANGLHIHESGKPFTDPEVRQKFMNGEFRYFHIREFVEFKKEVETLIHAWKHGVIVTHSDTPDPIKQAMIQSTMPS